MTKEDGGFVVAQKRETRKKRGVFALKSIVFLCLMGIMIGGVNRTLTLKYRHNVTNPLTETYKGFYRMKPGTVDVLILGSSQAASGINPQELYNGFGVRSYNLGSNHQSLWASYFWLKEAYKYQSPKAVILDCYELFRDCKGDEIATRQAFDEMRWGLVKWEAVKTVCNLNEELSWQSYFLTNIRFHTRWTGLNENDFTWGEFALVPQLKGFWLYRGKCGYQEFTPFEADYGRGNQGQKETQNPAENLEQTIFQEPTKEYLDKILRLCQDHGTELILIKTPTMAQTLERHNALADYADKYGLGFYDFNEKKLYEEIGFDYGQDMSDNNTKGDKNAHSNPSGARKITNYMGKELSEQYGLGSQKDDQWEETRDFGDGVWKDFQLRYENRLENYLEMLNDSRYTVFIGVKEDGFSYLREGVQKKLQELGLKSDWTQGKKKSYFAVVEAGQVLSEKMSKERLEELGSFREGKVIYQIVSAGEGSGNDCSIKINGGEQAKRKRGWNIVVYNHELRCVVDSVCFDVGTPELTAIR